MKLQLNITSRFSFRKLGANPTLSRNCVSGATAMMPLSKKSGGFFEREIPQIFTWEGGQSVEA
jgi:hypothetical protein